jgi:hypothetical protein
MFFSSLVFQRYMARRVTLKDEGDVIRVLVQTGQIYDPREIFSPFISFKSLIQLMCNLTHCVLIVTSFLTICNMNENSQR